MKVKVIGSGSAFSTLNNTSSIMIKDDTQNQWLIDCGPTVPRAIWAQGVGINEVNAIYFTHIHPDHCSGLPALLNQWKSFKRSEPLDIFCQADQQEVLEQLVALAIWPATTICFEIQWHEITDAFSWKHWQLQTAETVHEVNNRSLRLEIDDQVLFYSGDGRPTEATRQLMFGADLAFQECASFQALAPDSSHGDFPDCVNLLSSTQVKALGVYHCFDEYIPEIEVAARDVAKLFLSRDGMSFNLAEIKLGGFDLGEVTSPISGLDES
ncbi:MBL fold metallo-hydrolase [Leucothrix mucor]|uniref:MBL fold metallo-hydrolase n=1 Tax=Leucothrix mucor TaxID=45248 RepID=UPI0003B4397D|nr:ribonuclease Z [Leucothrix mucor]